VSSDFFSLSFFSQKQLLCFLVFFLSSGFFLVSGVVKERTDYFFFKNTCVLNIPLVKIIITTTTRSNYYEAKKESTS